MSKKITTLAALITIVCGLLPWNAGAQESLQATPPAEQVTPGIPAETPPASPAPTPMEEMAEPNAAPPPQSAPAPAPAPPVPVDGEGNPIPPQPSTVTEVNRQYMPDSRDAGRWVRSKSLNSVLQILARKAGYGYFSNPKIEDAVVTGHLASVDPVENLRDLATMYALTLYKRGSTIYALTPEQVASLPRRELIYQLRYLRGTSAEDQERLLSLIEPLISENGAARFEAKTSTLVVIDNEYALNMVRDVLEAVDVPKRQVAIEVKILRINNDNSRRVGVDWSNTLGKQGLSISATAVGEVGSFANQAIFADATSVLQTLAGGQNAGQAAAGIANPGIVPADGGGAGAIPTPSLPPAGVNAFSGDGIILNPLTVTAVVRALIDSNLAKQTASPRIVTEDNETASFGIIDYVPIVTQTVSQTTGVNNISTEVSYDITSGKAEVDIGVSIQVQPTILPDGTIRMRLLPKVGTITSFVEAPTGVAGFVNRYPVVNEAKAESIARIPNGYSLLLSGYYQHEDRVENNKVPLLGDLPLISFAFRSSQTTRVRSNLLFIITPTLYDAHDIEQTVEQTERLRTAGLTNRMEATSPDPAAPGENTDPDIVRFVRNFWPVKPKAPAPQPDNVLYYDEDDPIIQTPQQVNQQRIQQRIRRAEAP
jgi:Flp pilus assembly secretin CpaC